MCVSTQSARTLGALLLMTGMASAQAADALPTFNQAALARSFALPGLGATTVLDDGRWSSHAGIDLSSEYFTRDEGDEAILLDGETAAFTFAYKRGLPGGFEAGVELPLLVLGGGFLDSAIENWHDTFSLPDGGRELAPRDRYRYQYIRDGQTLLDVGDSGSYLGDVRLNAGWRAAERLALRAQLKLPTGDEDKLTGGNIGGALWADLGLPLPAGVPLSIYLSGGASINQKSGPLHEQQNAVIGFGGLGLSAQVFDKLALIGQLYAHSRLYQDSELPPLQRAGLQLSVATRWRLSAATLLDIGFQEDLIVSSSPDFSVHVGLGYSP